MSNNDKVKSLILSRRGFRNIYVFDIWVYLIKNVMINDFLLLMCTALLDLFVHLVILLFLLNLSLRHLLSLLDLGFLLLNLGLRVLLILLLQLVYIHHLINTDKTPTLLEFKVTNCLVLFVRVSRIRDECALDLVHGEERVELVKYGLHVLIINLVGSYNIPCYFL
jgi:hypothetical protein